MKQDLSKQRSVAMILSVLTALFSGRVAAQLVQSHWDVSALPAFDAWSSGAIAYPLLVLVQLTVIGLMAWAVKLVLAGRYYGRTGLGLCIFGSAYLSVMIMRAIMGYLGLADSAWFDYPIPTAFHFVLAGFCLILGCHWSGARSRQAAWHRLPSAVMPYVSYPAVIVFGVCLFDWLAGETGNLAFSAYLSVTLGATAILAHELLLPYRTTWLPSGRTIGWDVAYLALVQVMVPALLSLFVVAGITVLADRTDIDPAGFWPHHWPVGAQIILMMLIADLLRYWLHRASHKVKWLWALHAVHHAPKELYFLNVGRFHPGDKALQFLLDAMPFALMGVGSEVLAGYFVFYAINGFFQHSNADLKLAALNWIISGPELHRWHHAKAYELANYNFGNNLIIWDVIFGTRYLPAGDQVGELGIGNDDYPDDIVGQTLAPFVTSPDTDQRQ